MATEALNRRVVRVPDVVGQPARQGAHPARGRGPAEVVVLYRETYEDRNTVLDQRPARGQMVYEGSEVTIWIARRGYLEHLPAIYRRSDGVGRNLVRDMCWLFEHMFDSILDNLDDGWRFYDPHVAPQDFLDWLSQLDGFHARSRLARAAEARAREARRRPLSHPRHEARPHAVLEAVHRPRARHRGEQWPFKGFRVEGEGAEEGARVGLDSVVLPPVDLAHCFVVTMPIKFDDVTPEMVIRIHQIIQIEKPAHTHYYLQFAEEEGDVELREFFAIGLRSGIGIGAEVVRGERPKTQETREA